MNTTYFLNNVAGNVFNTMTTPPLPRRFYVGLSATLPSIDGSGVTEPSTAGTAYARVELVSLSVPVNGVVTNTTAVVWPTATLAWGTSSEPTLKYLVVYDSDTVGDGNLLWFSRLKDINNEDYDMSVGAGATLSIEPEKLHLSVVDV